MNTLESITKTNPFGKEDVCAKFVIDDLGSVFTLSDIAVIGEEYTFSFWVMADADSTMSVCGANVAVTSAWKKNVVTFTAAAENISLVFGSTGTYYVYHPQLEIGNKATDWTLAPEDMETRVGNAETKISQNEEQISLKANREDVDNVANRVSSQQTLIDQNAEQIDLRATKTEVSESLGEFYTKTETDAKFSVQSDRIDMQFESTEEQISNVDGDLQSWKKQYSKHISFSEDGIIIGSGNNAITLTLDNEDGIVFKKNGVQFGWWDGVDFHTGNIVVDVNERAQFGNFAFVPRSDGSLMFLKVGG